MHPIIGIPCQSNLRSKYRRFCIGQSYCRALQLVGAAPLLIPPLDDPELLLTSYRSLDGLLLAGGGDVEPHHFGEVRRAALASVDRPRDSAELLLARRAMEDDLPVLAICRGLQVLTVAMGGTLCQDISAQVPDALRHNFHPDHPRNHMGHEITVMAGTRLATILGAGRLSVNSFHHQCVRDVPPLLQVAARATDGVIEALEAPQRRFVLGLQWHPEELIQDDPRMRRLFEDFVGAASRR